MTTRDTPTSELLSAFADGELTPQERVQLEPSLKTNQSRRFLAFLQTLAESLRGLPRERLDEQFPARVLQAADRCRTRREQPAVPSDELVTAYVDDELSLEDSLWTETQFAADPGSLQYLEMVSSQRAGWQLLPRYQLDAQFHHRVLAAVRQAEAAGWTGEEEDFELPTSIAPASPAGKRPTKLDRRRWLNVALTAAALLIVAVTAIRSWRPSATGPSLELQAVLDRPLKKSLVLVCEVTVSTDAARQELLKRALLRNRILEVNAIRPNSSIERRLLESQRFGQQPADQGELLRMAYLLTTGRRFDALWFDLLDRPREHVKVRLDLLLDEPHQRCFESIDEASREDLVAQAISPEAEGIVRDIETSAPLYLLPTLASTSLDLSSLLPLNGQGKTPDGQEAPLKRALGDDAAVRVLLIVRSAGK